MATDDVVRARHFDYTPGGVPVFRRLPNARCADGSPGGFIAARQVDYTPEGYPILAFAFECCDKICPDDTTGLFCYEGQSCYVEPDCWPVGEGPGILRVIDIFLTDVNNCATARNKETSLCYDNAEGAWLGSVSLRGGTLDLRLECQAGAPNSPNKFRLSWTGCDTGFLGAGADCLDPLVINFGQANFPGCCDCPITGSPSTDVVPEINFFAATNCKKVLYGRHVNYVWLPCAGECRYQWLGGSWVPITHTCTPDNCLDCPPLPDDLSPGSTEGQTRAQPCRTRVYPVIAREKPDCMWKQGDPAGCYMECGVVATVTAEGPCACMSGTYDMSYANNEWFNFGGWPCSGGVSGTMTMTCTAHNPNEPEGPAQGFVRLCLNITCGATNTGTACLDIPEEDLEDLDVTFDVSMADPTVCTCAGSCTWTFNDMTLVWELTGDTCTCGGQSRPNDCDECPNAPANPPPSPVGGQQHSEPCTGGTTPPCCVGTIGVRVMR